MFGVLCCITGEAHHQRIFGGSGRGKRDTESGVRWDAEGESRSVSGGCFDGKGEAYCQRWGAYRPSAKERPVLTLLLMASGMASGVMLDHDGVKEGPWHGHHRVGVEGQSHHGESDI